MKVNCSPQDATQREKTINNQKEENEAGKKMGAVESTRQGVGGGDTGKGKQLTDLGKQWLRPATFISLWGGGTKNK